MMLDKFFETLTDRFAHDKTMSLHHCRLLTFVPHDTSPPFVRLSFVENGSVLNPMIQYAQATVTLVTRFLGQKEQVLLQQALEKMLVSPLEGSDKGDPKTKYVFVACLESRSYSIDRDQVTQQAELVYRVKMKHIRSVDHV